jgi:hypothetical protein
VHYREARALSRRGGERIVRPYDMAEVEDGDQEEDEEGDDQRELNQRLTAGMLPKFHRLRSTL